MTIDANTTPTNPDAMESTPAPARCLNCDSLWQGRFCQGCGQRRPLQPLTMPALTRDLVERIINLEQGLVRTLWGLLVHPRQTIQAYLDGQRRTLSHPFALLAIVATLSVLSVSFYGDTFWAAFRTTVAASAEQWLNPAQLERFKDFWVMLFGVLPYWMLIYSLPTALLLRALFPRQSVTVAELWVAVMYAIGLAIAIDVPTTLILIWADISMSVQMNTTQALLTLAQAWVLGRWLGRNTWGWIRIVLAILLSNGLSSVLQVTAAMTYAHWPVA